MLDNTWTVLEFYVPGKPQPQPKTQARMSKSGQYLGQRHRDEKGDKARWANLVRLTGNLAMRGREMLPAGVACRLGVEVRVKQAKSNHKPLPTQIPDWSNYWYYIENILKGCVYKDDCQVIGPLPGDKLWATLDRPEGAYVTIKRVI